MAYSAVDLCNSALVRLGANTITSFADNSPEARQCAIAYDTNRRDELRRNKWNFAITRVTLAPDATAPAFDYLYQFTIPSNCLRVLRPATAGLDWKIEGRKILTNDSATLYLRYIADIEEVPLFDASFTSVFTISLATDMCEKLTQSTTKKRQLNEEYEDALREARRMNAFEAGPDDAPDDDWLLARY